jgi:group I intron endonuclease
MFVYLVINQVNSKKYVGQTSWSIERRWKKHVWDAVRGGRRSALHAAIVKYGAGSFTLLRLARIRSETAGLVDQIEKEFIKAHQSLAPRGYNIRPGGDTSTHSPETRAKIRASLLGRRREPFSVETRARMSAAMMGNKRAAGRRMTEDNKMKLTVLARRPKSAETRAKISATKLARRNDPFGTLVH